MTFKQWENIVNIIGKQTLTMAQWFKLQDAIREIGIIK